MTIRNDFNSGADEDGNRYDPVSLMFKERVILVHGQVGTEMAYNITAQLKKLEYLDSETPITLLINSPGGSVIDGMAIVDIMREIKCPIITVGNGMQASMGSILLAAGDERKMTKNSQLLIHQIMGGAQSGTQHSDFEINGAHMASLHESLKSVYVEFTGLNHKFWDVVGERDTWLTAEQALKIGFIQHIVHNEKRGGPFAKDSVRSDDDGLQAVIRKAVQEHISKMSAEEIVGALNNANADGGLYARLRGDLVVRLSEFPEFWTDTKKTLEAQKRAAVAVANDDVVPVARHGAKKSSAPGL